MEYILYKMKGYPIQQYKTFSICQKTRYRRYRNNFILLSKRRGLQYAEIHCFYQDKEVCGKLLFVSEQLWSTIKSMQGVRVSHIDQGSLQTFRYPELELAGCQWPKAG